MDGFVSTIWNAAVFREGSICKKRHPSQGWPGCQENASGSAYDCESKPLVAVVRVEIVGAKSVRRIGAVVGAVSGHRVNHRRGIRVVAVGPGRILGVRVG